MEATSSYIQTITDRIVRHFDPVQIILFGSRAREETHEGSDVDLLVVLPRVADKRETAIAVRRVLRDLPVAKDIIVATPEEIERRGHLIGTVLRPALQEGTVLYERT